MDGFEGDVTTAPITLLAPTTVGSYLLASLTAQIFMIWIRTRAKMNAQVRYYQELITTIKVFAEAIC